MRDINQVFTERFFRLQVQGPQPGATATGPPMAPEPPAGPKVTESSDIDLLLPGVAKAKSQLNRAVTSGPEGSGPQKPQQRSVPKVGRNDPCPCGSGKKYKKCHGGGR